MTSPRHILFVEPERTSFWTKTRAGWRADPPHEPAPRDFLLVTDLPEEACTAEALPSLGFYDRKSLAARRLLMTYPEANLRGMAWLGHPLWGAGHAAFFALPSCQRVEEVAAEHRIAGRRISGVRTSSLLMWERARKKFGRGVCLVVSASSEAVRLLAMADGRPVLTRHLNRHDLPEGKPDNEIRLTWRYLVNQRIAPDASEPVVHWLGKESSPGQTDWPATLFEVASRVEIAPLDLRAESLARRIGRRALHGAGIAAVASLAVSMALVARMVEDGREIVAAAVAESRTKAEAESLETRIAATGISVDALRAARSFHAATLTDGQIAPADDLRALAQALGRLLPSVRASRIEWRRAEDGKNACAASGSAVQEMGNPTPGVGTSNPTPGAEMGSTTATPGMGSATPPPPRSLQRALDLSVKIDANLGPRARAAILAALSSALHNIPGANLAIDGGMQTLGGKLATAGGGQSDSAELRYCLILAGDSHANR